VKDAKAVGVGAVGDGEAVRMGTRSNGPNATEVGKTDVVVSNTKMGSAEVGVGNVSVRNREGGNVCVSVHVGVDVQVSGRVRVGGTNVGVLSDGGLVVDVLVDWHGGRDRARHRDRDGLLDGDRDSARHWDWHFHTSQR